MESTMVMLEKVSIIASGTAIEYFYNCQKNIRPYFSDRRLFVDYGTINVSDVPESILVIPFVANLLPISWFVGFDIRVSELDEDFFQSAEAVKAAFAKLYPDRIKENSNIVCDRLVKNSIPGSKSAMLFSGGIDAYTTFIRHQNEDPLLVTIHGADISIADEFQWQLLQKKIDNAEMLSNARNASIKTNMRRFYSHKVNELIDDLDWWGRIQHAFSMLTLLAPLTFVKNVKKIYIASSATETGKFKWGSSPNIDNQVRWADVNIMHDAFDLDRFEKVKLLVNTVRTEKRSIEVKVCYQVGQVEINCSKCDKCLRSIILFICAGADPNQFGFVVDEDIYQRVTNRISKGFENDASIYVWRIVLDAINSRQTMFYFSDRLEEEKLNGVGRLLQEALMKNITPVSNRKQALRMLQLKHRWIADLKSRMQRFLAQLKL